MQEQKELEYIKILIAIDKMPFNVGKKLLIDFLLGNEDNDTIQRFRLNKKDLFGYFSMFERNELEDLVENLYNNSLIEYRQMDYNKFAKVLALTDKGKKEIIEPSLYKKKLMNNFQIIQTEITETDRHLFEAFGFFLKNFNDGQKKAIVEGSSRILTIAGAGSGKTTVLTKRIEFLATFKSVDPKKILAITFTRKARTEMAQRLSKSRHSEGVMIETFNSFCEKIISRNNDMIYGKRTRVISFSEKISLFKTALRENNIELNLAITGYFSMGQRREKTNDELVNLFMNDCYSILEIYKMNNQPIESLNGLIRDVSLDDQKNLAVIYKICKYIDETMKRHGLRDYSDQISHCLNFFRTNPGLIPKFEHILVDEFQDVNSQQIDLIDFLNPPNLFCVGDPRQSIFGWRGSKIKYILNFEEKYPECKIITLSTNYRSSKQIVDLINKSLEGSRLPELNSFIDLNSKVHLVGFETEEGEMSFVVQKILELNLPRNEIFVLARTNRIVKELSQRMRVRGIRHIVKTEESRRDDDAAKDEVTIATIHSIKGLEAEAVFVIGCNGSNFPCKASDHPIIELVKMEEYDKEEEERRLFYVALSRAKNELYLTYSGKNHTRFINQSMLKILSISQENNKLKIQEIPKLQMNDVNVLARLKSWRRELSSKLNLPAYIIMHDKTLMEISSMMPQNLEDLGNIRGIGPSKIDKYGEEIIRIVNG